MLFYKLIYYIVTSCKIQTNNPEPPQDQTTQNKTIKPTNKNKTRLNWF